MQNPIACHASREEQSNEESQILPEKQPRPGLFATL